MRTIAVPSRARTLNALLKRARKENIILRALDGHEFVLAEIDDFNREIELTRQNAKLMKLLDQRGRQRATISLPEARQKMNVK
jgi:hypothetical protein